MSKASKNSKRYDTDSFMRKLYGSLVRDFRSVMGPTYKEREVNALLHSIKAFRSCKAPDRLQAPPSIFKMEAQLEALFKRYRFKTDVYTDEELSKRTFDTFMEGQLRLAQNAWRDMPLRTFTVVQRARKIVKGILDGFLPTPDETVCRFSTRATVGSAARDAYLDHKLFGPLTGSPEHVKWFNTHLNSHSYLASTLNKCAESSVPVFESCDSLPLVGVPKSYKSLRLISPNTLIGSYYTYGLGKILVEALRNEGLDIAKLQGRHKVWAMQASKHRKWVTADLSAASESFLWSLINRLCPRHWVRALDKGRLRSYTLNKRRYHYCSFMAMGIGFTFPLQTLLFYALVKAVCELSKVDGLVSVYGDDLIYPRQVHKIVATVLQDLGMKLNEDKTFVQSNFRESCGGDYYHGVDVRPFSPEGQCQQLSRRNYEAWLYQMANGLFARWDQQHIPITARFLRMEVLRVARLVKQVPRSFPDYSGIRCDKPETSIFSAMQPVLVRFRNGSREYVVSHLTQVAKHRMVSFEDAYLYDWLRARAAGEECDEYDGIYLARGFDAWLERDVRRLRANVGQHEWLSANGRVQLSLRQFPTQPKSYRGRSGRRLKRCYATTPCKLEPQQIQTKVTDSISDWI